MNGIKGLLFLICLAFSQNAQTESRGWHGIVPLHSTRQDVERLLGPGKGPCHCEYSLEDGNVSIQYSGEPCAEVRERGWKVRRDTVINISFYPKVNPRFSELPIDKAMYIKTADPEIQGVFSYHNETDGILIEVEGDIVSGFYYTPTKRDEHLRCPRSASSKTTKEARNADELKIKQGQALEFKELSSVKGTTKDGAPYSTQIYESPNGVRVSVTRENRDSSEGATRELRRKMKSAIAIIERTSRVNNKRQMVGERIVAAFRRSDSSEREMAILWTEGRQFYYIESWSMPIALEFEKKFYG